MEGVSRWKTGELVVGAWMAAGSLLLWWGAKFFQAAGPLPAFGVGLIAAGIGFTVLNIVEETNAHIRRFIVVGSFLLAIPFVLLSTGLWGLGAVVAASVLVEIAELRAERFRKSLRHVRTFTLARFLLPEYFSAVSAILAVVIVFSPVGGAILDNPLPQGLVRTVLQWIHVPSIPFPPGIDLRNPEARKQFSKLVGVDIAGDDDFAAIVSKIAAGQTRKLQAQHEDLYRFTFVLGAFGILRVFSVAFSWLTMPFLYLFLGALKSFRRVSAVEEPSVRSVLKWE